MKKMKTIVVFLMLVTITLPAANIVGAVSQNEGSKTISLEYGLFGSDGTQTSREMTVNTEDIALFSQMMSRIYQKTTLEKDYNIQGIISSLEQEFGASNIFSMLLSASGIRPLQKRVFILSDGYGFKLDFHLRTEFSIHRRFTFWLYNTGNTLTSSRTIIIDPIPNSGLKFFKYLEGNQFGIMTKFTGFYIRIPGKFMEDRQSHTFFFGYAGKVRAFDLPDSTITI